MVRRHEDRFQYLQLQVGGQPGQVLETENVLMETPVLIILEASLFKALKVTGTGILAEVVQLQNLIQVCKVGFLHSGGLIG
jgi:hypothetical protein